MCSVTQPSTYSIITHTNETNSTHWNRWSFTHTHKMPIDTFACIWFHELWHVAMCLCVYAFVWSVNGFSSVKYLYRCIRVFLSFHITTIWTENVFAVYVCVVSFDLNLFYICAVVNMDDMPNEAVLPSLKNEKSNPSTEACIHIRSAFKHRMKFGTITVITNKREVIRYTHTSGVSKRKSKQIAFSTTVFSQVLHSLLLVVFCLTKLFHLYRPIQRFLIEINVFLR